MDENPYQSHNVSDSAVKRPPSQPSNDRSAAAGAFVAGMGAVVVWAIAIAIQGPGPGMSMLAVPCSVVIAVLMGICAGLIGYYCPTVVVSAVFGGLLFAGPFCPI